MFSTIWRRVRSVGGNGLRQATACGGRALRYSLPRSHCCIFLSWRCLPRLKKGPFTSVFRATDSSPANVASLAAATRPRRALLCVALISGRFSPEQLPYRRMGHG